MYLAFKSTLLPSLYLISLSRLFNLVYFLINTIICIFQSSDENKVDVSAIQNRDDIGST